MQVWSLGREDPLEWGMATHSNILAWRIPWTEEPGGLPSDTTGQLSTLFVHVLNCTCTVSLQLCPTLFDPMNYSYLGSSVLGIFHSTMMEWVAIPFSRASSWPRDWTQVSCIAGEFFTDPATREALFVQKPCQRYWLKKTIVYSLMALKLNMGLA